MQIVTDGRAAMTKSVLALGMFDGVHIGHRVLLERAKVLAKRNHAPLVACTFTGHPLELIAPDRCPPALTTFDERVALLEEMGVDLLFAQPFTEEMRQMLPEVYVGELVRRFHPTDVVCGYNHTFGKNGSGTSAFLAALGDALGFRTQVVPQVTLNGAEVSSSAIRKALVAGNTAAAASLLGRPYQLLGNIDKSNEGGFVFEKQEDCKLTPPAGRYRCLLQAQAGSKAWPCTVRISEKGPWSLGTSASMERQSARLLLLASLLNR